MLICVWSPCGREATYVYSGKSLCPQHFEITVDEVRKEEYKEEKMKVRELKKWLAAISDDAEVTYKLYFDECPE